MAIRLAISTRRADAFTRFIARFWLDLGLGERNSEISRTAASLPLVSKIGAAVQDRGVCDRPK